MSPAPFSELEAAVDYSFDDPSLLERALTHSSLSGGKKRVPDLERLEFLGDRVLGLLTAEELWRRHPKMREGDLAPRLNALVRKETCAKAALFWELDKYMRLSRQEENAGGRRKKAILGDVCEAFLGALYIDGGLEAARRAFDPFWLPNFEALSRRHRDAKTTLQEWSQERGKGTPKYSVVEADGPAHDPAFTVEVSVKGFDPAIGKGRSKRAAQTSAAEVFLIREEVWTEND